MIKQSNNVNSLRCIYSNVDTLSNKTEEIKTYIPNNDVDVAVFTETLPKNPTFGQFEEKKVEEINDRVVIPGYTYEENVNGRGVCLIIKNIYEFSRMRDLEDIFSPSLFFRVILSKEEAYTLGLIYRSPNNNKEDNENLNHLIESVYNSQTISNDDIILLGDFNYPYIDWESETSNKNENDCSSKFLNTVNENYLFQIVKEPTHLRGTQRPTLIDLIFVKDENIIDNLQYLPPFGNSHHQVLDFNIILKSCKQGENKVTKFLINKGDFKATRNYFVNKDWDILLDEN